MVKEAPTEPSGMSENAAWRADIPSITVELAPQNRIRNSTVKMAVRSIENLLKEMGVVEGSPDLPELQMEFGPDHEETQVVTEREGLLVTDFEPGDRIQEGQTAARVISLETLGTLCRFEAPYNGLVYNIGAGLGFGEDHVASSVVFPGQTVGLLKRPTRVLRNG
jgi:predicted deacylase